MLYVDALCHGIDELPTVPDTIRNSLKQQHDALGYEWLLEELRRIDPEYYEVVDRRNMKRVFHAVEIVRAVGTTYTSLRTGERRQREFKHPQDLSRPAARCAFRPDKPPCRRDGTRRTRRRGPQRVSHACAQFAQHRRSQRDVRLVRRCDGPPHGHRTHQKTPASTPRNRLHGANARPTGNASFPTMTNEGRSCSGPHP